MASFNTLFKLQESKKEKRIQRLKDTAEKRIMSIIQGVQQRRRDGEQNAIAWYIQRTEEIKASIASTSKKMKTIYDKFQRDMNEFVKLHSSQCAELSDVEHQLTDKLHLIRKSTS